VTPLPSKPDLLQHDRAGSNARLFIIADDLTGACDAASPFTLRGQRVEVLLTRDAHLSSASVISVSTDSRNTSERISLLRLRATLRELPIFPQDTLFKKIDSLCRDNTFAEIRAVVSRFPEHLFIFAPSFPELGRNVVSGCLHVDHMLEHNLDLSSALNHWDIPHCLFPKAESLEHRLADIRSQVRYKNIVFLCDASSNADLDRVAQTALSLNRKVIWIGSGGLARALANALYRKPNAVPTWILGGGALLLCIGSKHPVTMRQIGFAIRRSKAKCVTSGGECAASVTGLLESDAALIWMIDRELNSSALRTMLMPFQKDHETTLLLSGGDTAAHLCAALSVESIAIAGELIPGVPWGFIRGGEADGMRVITKSGSFGAEDALISIMQKCCGRY
jgi:uncharacterized protein YgbK (DUF1537 family)